jgi:hypothetical protein
MKIKELLINVLRSLGYDELASDLNSGATLTKTNEQIRTDALDCVNRAIERLAITVCPFYSVRTITVTNGDYDLTRLPERFFKVENLSKNGERVPYTVFGATLTCKKNGSLKICYRYVPHNLTEDEELDCAPIFIERLVLYGALMEFCLRYGRFSDAWNWKTAAELEEETLRKATPTRAGAIPPRDWS